MFTDRIEAGRRLAAALESAAIQDPIVLGLPRGGVPVAYEVAHALHAPLDVIVVRKLGVPFQPELAMGALGEDGVRVLNRDIIELARISADDLRIVEQRERREVDRRARALRGGRPALSISGRTVILVDDGIATGATTRAAIEVARAHGASRVVVAVPVAPAETVAMLRSLADEVVCLESPEPFGAVGAWYRDFRATTDADVVELLHSAGWPDEPRVAGGALDRMYVRDEEVTIPSGTRVLEGRLSVPSSPFGLVLFAHGSGSSRHSPRNRAVARALHARGLGTLLFDLLVPDEAIDRARVFDIPLLAARLTDATRWLRGEPEAGALAFGYFGASTGAAAALWAAAEPDSDAAAIVSRGGRPDMAEERLREVRAPTLLVVGGADDVVLELDRYAASRLLCPHEVAVIPGATHLFEEPGALEVVADLAGGWFLEHLSEAG